MTKRMRFIVSVLFIVIIVLALAITRFYSSTSKSAGSGSNKTDITRFLSDDGSGNRIFEDDNGLYGVADSSDRIIVSPEWLELDFAGGEKCIASKRISGRLMTGCVDYEGNIVVPLVYRNITKHSYGSFSFYIAESAADSSCVLYSEDLLPLFTRSWDSFTLAGDELTLSAGPAKYSYSLSSSGFSMHNAQLSGTALDCPYTMEVTSRLLLERLEPDMLEEMTRIAGKYIEYAFTGSGEYLSDIRSGGRSAFSLLFPDDKQILSKKLTDIPNIYIYSVKSDDDIPHYAVSVTARTELTYTDKEDRAQTLTGDYKAVIEFSGTTKNELVTISGEFRQAHPDYPEPESEVLPPPPPDTDTANNDFPPPPDVPADNGGLQS